MQCLATEILIKIILPLIVIAVVILYNANVIINQNPEVEQIIKKEVNDDR